MFSRKAFAIIFILFVYGYFTPLWGDSISVMGQWSNPPSILPPVPNPFAATAFSLTFDVPTPISSVAIISTDSFAIQNVTGSYTNNGVTTTFTNGTLTFLDSTLGGGFNLDVNGLFQSQPADLMTFDFNGQSAPVLYTGPLSNPTLIDGNLTLSGFGQYQNQLFFTGTRTAFTNGGASYVASPVPEPSTLSLFAVGMLGLLCLRAWSKYRLA